jgi:UDP-3-O-[3-hydroxymyristoyl] glucosamine N-acyltransferase
VPTIGEIASLVNGQFSGDADRAISAVRPLGEAGGDDLTFLAGSRYEHLLRDTRAAAILVPNELPGEDSRFIRVQEPQLALAQVLHKWFAEIPKPPVGVSPKAQVASTASIGDGTRIGAYAIIRERARIGRDVTIFDGAFIGADCVVSDQSIIYPNATLYHGTRVGRRCIIHAGVVLGSDGYGFVTSGGVHHKIPQVGIVRVEDDVEIGAGTTVDRATLGETVIGEGTKIDNLVQIGHNARIGRHCLLVAQVAIAGSAELGDYVVMAGQAGIAGHLRIGSGVKVAAKAAVMKNQEGDVTLAGNPARPLREHMRAEAMVRRLPELLERVEELEKKAGTSRKGKALKPRKTRRKKNAED